MPGVPDSEDTNAWHANNSSTGDGAYPQPMSSGEEIVNFIFNGIVILIYRKTICKRNFDLVWLFPILIISYTKITLISTKQ